MTTTIKNKLQQLPRLFFFFKKDIKLTTKMLQSVLREKNSNEVSPPLSNGLMFSFLLEYLMAPPFLRRYSSINTELTVALVFVP